jgi:hypothetical protein
MLLECSVLPLTDYQPIDPKQVWITLHLFSGMILPNLKYALAVHVLSLLRRALLLPVMHRWAISTSHWQAEIVIFLLSLFVTWQPGLVILMMCQLVRGTTGQLKKWIMPCFVQVVERWALAGWLVVLNCDLQCYSMKWTCRPLHERSLTCMPCMIAWLKLPYWHVFFILSQ